MAKATMVDMEDGAMGVAAAVKFSGLSRITLYRLMEKGRLPYHCLSGRKRLIPRKRLLEIMTGETSGSLSEAGLPAEVSP